MSTEIGAPLSVGVLVPARDEEERIGACLRSVRAALDRAGVPGALCVVADRCTDGTAAIARRYADVVVTTDDDRPIGLVRNLAADRLDGVDWLLSTDADSVVPADWVAEHLAHARHADVVAAPVELDVDLPPDVLARYAHHLGAHTGHAYAANLGVRGSTFRAVGGFPPVVHGEEHALLARVRAAGGRVLGPPSPLVRTSSRTTGRARGGLADLLRGMGA